MAVNGMALPILPDKVEAWEQYNSQVNGPRRSEFEDMLRRHGYTTWMVWRQRTPKTDLLIVFQEGPLSGSIGKSDHPFDMWFKEQVREFTGVDLGQLPPGPTSELVMQFPG